MKIALVYNGITREMLLQGPLDRTAEFDGPHTGATLREAIAIHGHTVTLIEAQPVLVEQFVDGREFTVPILGNTPARTLPVIEVLFQGPRNITLFQPDDDVIRMLARVHQQRLATPLVFRVSANHERALVQTDNSGVLEIPVALTRSVCPADIPATLAAALQDTALRAFHALECRDWCRVDMRVGADGMPQVLELDPIAGLAPACWFPRSAQAAGMDYPTLMRTILDIACQRYGL